MIRDASGHGWRRHTSVAETDVRRTKIIYRAHQEHPLVQRQGVACQRPAPARQRREPFPERRIQPVTVDRRIAPPIAAPERRV